MRALMCLFASFGLMVSYVAHAAPGDCDDATFDQVTDTCKAEVLRALTEDTTVVAVRRAVEDSTPLVNCRVPDSLYTTEYRYSDGIGEGYIAVRSMDYVCDPGPFAANGYGIRGIYRVMSRKFVFERLEMVFIP